MAQAISLNQMAGLSSEGSLSKYLQEIKKFPMLSHEEEFSLAKRWTLNQDSNAAHKLVTSHLRLVAKVAFGYKGYGLPMSEVVSEGSVGLMQAVKRFDPDRGFRLSTYALWWIKASIQDYILRSWSLVKLGTTANQKKLFFGLRRAKSKINAMNEGDLTAAQAELIATDLGVEQHEVIEMNRRLQGDSSLNTTLNADGDAEWQDLISDNEESSESVLIRTESEKLRHAALENALSTLNERERAIFTARRLLDDVMTLEELAEKHAVSRERIRQIEQRAFEKVQQAVLASNIKQLT